MKITKCDLCEKIEGQVYDDRECKMLAGMPIFNLDNKDEKKFIEIKDVCDECSEKTIQVWQKVFDQEGKEVDQMALLLIK